MNYLPTASGLHWGFGREFYQLAKQAGAVLECYASPFNASLECFCSPCATLDYAFGSLGPFSSAEVDRVLRNAPSNSIIVAAPPFIESDISFCTERVTDLLKRWSVTAVSLYPDWPDCEGVSLFKTVASSGGTAHLLQKQRFHIFNYETGQPFVAKFGCLAFVVGPRVGEVESLLEALQSR